MRNRLLLVKYCWENIISHPQPQLKGQTGLSNCSRQSIMERGKTEFQTENQKIYEVIGYIIFYISD